MTIEGDVLATGGFDLVEPVLPLSSNVQIVNLTIFGDLKGNIIADYGDIGISGGSGITGILVDGAAGEFNPATSTNNPVTVRSGRHIVAFSAGSFNGTLTAPVGAIYSVDITNLNGGTGQFVGEISGQRLADGANTGSGSITIDGDMGARHVSGMTTTLYPAEITFTSASGNQQSEILINGDFIESSEINLPANEVENRILINADNTGGNVWEEDAVITVGSAAMDGPDYAATRLASGTAPLPRSRTVATRSGPPRSKAGTSRSGASTRPACSSRLRARNSRPQSRSARTDS